MFRGSRRTLLAAAVTLPVTAAVVGVTGGPAQAAEYRWPATLAEMTSADIRQLQIRLAGYPGYRAVLAVDGVFGPRTRAALLRFSAAYSLPDDGGTGEAVFDKIYQLQDSDNTPVHFDYAEFDQCDDDWSGGAVSTATARENARRLMWKLEALRHALGDRPITVVGGFRSRACNDALGGEPDSRHLYGDAADIVAGSPCEVARRAGYHGFGEIFGAGRPGHGDGVHVASGGSVWSAPGCF
ncbi:zinc D-Ala-D-Ala carboxypeptidase [Stackebrandtia albiflava]|uniref:Zinc D-Ala-D-Ala carboxypeptidase n=1 Tax=Stackebrandtia albiflava TaxID=406432 RepID=A0A562URC1_9ACTN|nr:D-Ala-D-Ala carboxypeptidase family metallohydrolase [Stackebrandtia albiflava]TWJ08175.1 zinc D-Ala-D-Ala carboxypeptidase [Stackebrandtia albiflava]